MQKLKEVTGIADGFRYPEYVYYLNDEGKLVGFMNESGEEKIFKAPIAFYKARRKFKKIK